LDTWKLLLREALACLDATSARGVTIPGWTFGGGTVLMIRHGHRLSRDIDLFLTDAQFLPCLSPRLSDALEGRVRDYLEESASLKLVFDAGEVDFIVAPSLLGLPTEPLTFEGRVVPTDASAEILAKKLYYRGAMLKVRDVFDLAVVLAREPGVDARLRPVLQRQRAPLLRRLRDLEAGFPERMQQEVSLLPGGAAHVDGALRAARAFVESL
jgi:hypothetical protein